MCFGKKKDLSHLVKIVRIFMDVIYVEKFTIIYKNILPKVCMKGVLKTIRKAYFTIKNRAYGNAPCS